MPYCERCPLVPDCDAYKEAEEDNSFSYHPQQVVRVEGWEETCPLLILMDKHHLKEKPK